MKDFIEKRKTKSPSNEKSIFKSVVNDDTRRGGGIHYTSIDNIHKVIDPLFLDALNREFEICEDLHKFHDKIANLKFLDPACGSGNFLTETYISMRKLEDRIIQKIGGDVKISTGNFYGIEIEPIAVQIARKNFPNVLEGNALELDWKNFVADADFIIGNPPYRGARVMDKNQKSDVQKIFDGFKNLGNLDYVSCWFKKAFDYVRDSKTEVAFLSTDSICQGDSVGTLWKNLFDDGIKINFALTTFKWDLEAQVHCVIIGFANFDRPQKFIDGREVKNINAYLIDAPNIFVERLKDPICPVPKMTLGNMANDGGNLIIEEKDLDSFQNKKFIRPIIGAKEFLQNIPQYCLWLVDAEPSEIESDPKIFERVLACKNYRLASKRLITRKLAETPWLFGEIRQPLDGYYLTIPEVSSERRKYIPIGFLDSKVIAKNQMRIIPNATLELFGILTSSVHMAWTRVVCGRHGTGFDYSIQLVYNNFPFPKFDPRIESSAKKILDVRSRYKNLSFAKLYDPKSMPSELHRAHEENDLAVLESYGFDKNISESEIVSRLFSMYQKLIEGSVESC